MRRENLATWVQVSGAPAGLGAVRPARLTRSPCCSRSTPLRGRSGPVCFLFPHVLTSLNCRFREAELSALPSPRTQGLR